MPRCLVSLGSNVGDRHATLDAASRALEVHSGANFRVSGRIETPAVGGPPGQLPYVNAVAAFRADSTPLALLAELGRIEHAGSRTRVERWGERSLDLDLLLYDEQTVHEPTLCVPHPRMTFRRFVLEPACEIAADWRHPECDATLGELHKRLEAARGVTLVGDQDGAVAALIAAERPEVAILGTGDDGLTIDARLTPWPLGPSGPRLVLADCPREHWREEVLAALECVWPTAPRAAP